ncbi:hypothetical protein G6N82_06775 [Altererythrobacter sp. BO-6]|uniref:hypothetical protein n=1 Tax=Altererythrobacter sp. BO-6 TaxID=2604537 RepID=UPI0013E2012B|nr:hypothetical protein [Altererythrobacter sp. BO-6]QIG53897.1 hypothetical protein G6N82_06775 [Altererythrobacter sp. BO-6]
MTRGRKPRLIAAKRHDDLQPYIDPNSPSSPGYAERHRRKSYEIMPGMTRIDIGCEGD